LFAITLSPFSSLSMLFAYLFIISITDIFITRVFDASRFSPPLCRLSLPPVAAAFIGAAASVIFRHGYYADAAAAAFFH
jgi:hypothetical protein